MSTTTIYSDVYMVIVEHPRGIETAPWLDEVTYLIDANGQTTGLLEQTEKPTSGVSLEPIPFTPVQAAVINSATIKSQTSPQASLQAQRNAPPPSSTKSLSPTLTIALAIVGAILILVLIGAIWYLLRRRNMKTRAQNDDPKLRSEDISRQSTSVDVSPASPRRSPFEAGEMATSASMPRSILKPPKPSDTKGWMQTLLRRAGDERPTYDIAENGNGIKKKGVTFGEDQVRVFGRTPLPSRTASPMSRNTEE